MRRAKQLADREAQAEHAVTVLGGNHRIGQKWNLLQLCASQPPQVLASWKLWAMEENEAASCVLRVDRSHDRIVYFVERPDWMAGQREWADCAEITVDTEVIVPMGHKADLHASLILVQAGSALALNFRPKHPAGQEGFVKLHGWKWPAETFRKALGAPWGKR